MKGKVTRMLNKTPRHEAVRGWGGDIAACFLNLGARWRWTV